jgi:predicted RNase H-like HicB family nuclease
LEVQVCLEVGPKATGAFVPDCPGCWVFGRTKESALKKLEAVTLEWYGWLKGHGEVVKVPRAIRIEPAEILRVTYNPAEAGKPEPLFWSEVLPVSTKNIERALLLMEYSRSDLLRLCSELDTRALRWRPRGEPRTIYNCLKHIAIVEWWYISRLNIDLPKDFPRDLFELLRYTRRLAERSLRNLSNEKRTSIIQPKNDPSPLCDLWTARKVLRRFVDHERLHANYIKKVIRLYQLGKQ